jgi:hypothetical protein
VAGALLLLVGAGIALAGGTLTGRGPDGASPSTPATSRSMAAPTVVASATLTQLPEVDIQVSIASDAAALGARRIRVYVRDELVREQALEGQTDFSLVRIALAEGENEITATLAGEGREGPPSVPVTVVRDTRSPPIHISRPDPGSVVYDATETLRGRTEAGATIVVRDEHLGEQIAASVEPDGTFEATGAAPAWSSRVRTASAQ